MSFSDKLRSFWDKDKDKDKNEDNETARKSPASRKSSSGEPRPPSGKSARRAPDPVPTSPSNPQDIGQQIEKEKQENDAALKRRDKEANDLRSELDKLDLDAKSRREEHQQTSQMLRM